jgi:hypothetical protein
MSAAPRTFDAGGGGIERYALPLIVLAQIALMLVADPRGNFPLNDDWAYTHSVQWLFDEHRIRLSDWIAMNLLPQTLMGGAAVALGGYSFTVLRHLTQIVSIAVALLAFVWFETAGMRRRDAFVATLVVMAWPGWNVLSNSYMTDLYAMLFALPAATFFLRALERPAWRTLAIATALASIGMLQRQVVAVLPAAFLVATLLSTWPWRARLLLRAVLPLAVVFAAEFAYRSYLVHGPGLPEAQTTTLGYYFVALGRLIRDEPGYRDWVAHVALEIPCYLGLFAAPWLAWVGFGADPRGRRPVLLATAAIAAAMFAAGWFPPWRENNVIDAAGIGPYTLYDAIPRRLANLDRSPGAVWRVAAVVAAFGVAALARVIALRVRDVFRREAPRRARDAFVLALVAGYLAPFMITGYIDRYLLFVLPFALALAIPAEAIGYGSVRLGRALALAWIALVIGLSAAATHDYFAWNRARWDAIAAATRLGATPATLDAGFEYNGYHNFEVKPRGYGAGKSWWWVKDDRYVVAFTPVDGFAVLAQYPVKRWLARTPSTIYLLERSAP